MRVANSSAGAASWRLLEELLLPTAAAAALVFAMVGIWRPIWLDEAISLSIAREDFWRIAARLRDDNNFPFYYFLLHAWTRLFGDSEIAARSLSAVSYLAGSAAMYAGGRWAGLGKRAALYCSFFYLAGMQAVHQAQNVRMYALLGLLSAVSTACFCREFVRGDGSRRNWALYVSVNALGLLTHLWYPFVLAGQLAAAALWMDRRRLRAFLGAAMLSALPFALLWAPSFWVQLHNGGTAKDWMPYLNPWFPIRALLDFYGSAWMALPFYLICAALVFLGRPEPAGAAEDDDREALRVWITCAAVSLAVPLAISAFKPIYWPGRYTIVVLPPLAFLLGAALSRFAARPALTLLCYAVLACNVTQHIRARDINPETDLPKGHSDRTTAQFLLRNARPGDALIFTSLSRPAVDYYLRRAQAGSRFMEISFPYENGVHLGWRDTRADGPRDAALRTEASGLLNRLKSTTAPGNNNIWVLYGYDPSVSGILKEQLDQRLSLQRSYALPGPYHTSVLEYALAGETGGPLGGR